MLPVLFRFVFLVNKSACVYLHIVGAYLRFPLTIQICMMILVLGWFSSDGDVLYGDDDDARCEPLNVAQRSNVATIELS